MKKYLFGLWLVLGPLAVLYYLTASPFGGNGLSRSLQDKTKLQYPMPEEQKATLRRGFQVYIEVCSSCHGLNRIKFDYLHGDTGFVTLHEALNKARERVVNVLHDYYREECHVMVTKKGDLSDYYPSPYSCDGEAMSNNGGAMPYDLSMIARYQPPMYTYDILTSYTGSEKEEMGATYYKNIAAGANDEWIAMPPPLYGEDVDYDDGTVATLEQEAMDISVFLEWAANPKQAKAHYYIEKAILVGSLCVLLSFVLLVYVWQKNAKVTIVQKVKSIWRHWINQFKK